MEPEYSSKIYEKDPSNIELLGKIKEPCDLVKFWYNIPLGQSTPEKKKRSRLSHIYDKIPSLSGHGLEMAYGFGVSIYVLMKKYSTITFDAFDFCQPLEKVGELMKGLHPGRVKDVWIGSSECIPKPDNYYDFINSCSFFEHIPDAVFDRTIKEAYRVLKPGGFLGVYLDKNKGLQHIRLRAPDETKKEIDAYGFESDDNYVFRKPK